VRTRSSLLAMALAIAALALPSVAAANQSQTVSHHHLGTLTVQVEAKGPNELGWSSLGFKLSFCRAVSRDGCSYSLTAVEVSPSAEDCPEVISDTRISQLHRAYFRPSYGGSFQAGAHSFNSFSIGSGKAVLCWYLPSPLGSQRNVALTTITVPS
jgi:hypothetical protein